MNTELYSAKVNGKRIVFTGDCPFTVEVGKGSKGAYQRRYSFTGMTGLHVACQYYDCINVGRGYKKRLVMQGKKRLVLAKATSV